VRVKQAVVPLMFLDPLMSLDLCEGEASGLCEGEASGLCEGEASSHVTGSL
jgi:hypothetical protein